MSGKRLFALALTALLLTSLAACGQHSSRILSNIINPQAQQQQQPQDGSTNNGPLPGVFELDGRIAVNRAVSADQTITSQGWDALHQGWTGTNGSNPLNVEQNGTALNLRAFSPGEYSFAVYGQDIGAEPKPLQTLIDSDVCKIGGGRDDEIPVCYYIGAADYTVGAWRWFGPFGDTGVMVMVNSDSLKSRFKSPSNNYYLCVLAANGSKAASALPAEGYVADFPIDLSARSASEGEDDPGGLTIEEIVTWVRDNLHTEPAVVTGLAAAVDEAGVTLTWDRNADPDVFLYQVIRTDAPLPSIIATVTPSEELPSYRDNNCVPGKKSIYKLRARNDAGFGGASVITAIRELCTPSVSASDGAFPDKIRVSWTQVEGAVSYKIYRADSADGPKAVVHEFSNLETPLEWDDNAVTVETNYWYWVQPQGEDEPDGPMGGPETGFTVVLDPVQVIASDGQNPDKVVLTWGEEASAERYYVYRSTDETKADAVMIANRPSSNTTWADTSATGSPWDSPRYYFVRPYFGLSEGPEGQGDYGFRNLAIPQNVTASQGTDAQQVTVNWDTVNNATRYKIYRSSLSNDPSPTEVGEVDAPLTTFNDAAPGWGTEVPNEGTHYYYYVAALHAGPDTELSLYSASAEGWRGIGIPQNVSATDGNYTDRIVISWDSVSQADAYNVYRGGSYIGQAAAPATMYSDYTAIGGNSYSYTVAALTVTAEVGAQSAADNGHVNIPPVADLTADVTEGYAPLTVNFDASGSYDTDGSIVDYQWDWTSDGTYDYDSGADPTASKHYTPVGDHTCTVMVIDEEGAATATTLTVSVIAQGWVIQTLDNAGNVGEFANLKVINGLPAISYYNVAQGCLKYIRANDVDGGAWGDPISLDMTVYSGKFNSLGVVNGHPAISYLDDTNRDLRYIRASDSTGAEWGSPVTVDSDGLTGYDTSLCIVEGYPAISYWKYSPSSLVKYVRATDVNGTEWSTPIIVTSLGTAPDPDTSLIVINGRPAIAYSHWPNLKYVTATDTIGSEWNTPVLISSGSNGPHSSLAIVNGCPAVSFYISASLDLGYAIASDSEGVSWDTVVSVDTAGSVGQYSSLVVVNGLPAISYMSQTGHDLKYVIASNTTGTEWDAPKFVDQTGNAGYFTSLAVVNGNLAIAYFESTDTCLKFARLQ